MRHFLGILLAMTALLTACGQKAAEAPQEATAQVFAMDTVMELTACGETGEAAVRASEKELYTLEALLSRTREGSEVWQINQNGSAPTEISSAVQELLAAAGEYCRATGGAFDITVAPVAAAWGFTADRYQVPESAALERLVKTVDGQQVALADGAVSLGEGQSIDLGGIAKGYASDCVERLFRENGVESGKITLGGNVFVCGGKADGAAWRIGIQDPNDPDALAGILSLKDAYAITSGGYQRYFEENGVRYHHIIDPATGFPAESGLISVTVVAEANGENAAGPGNGAMCDAFSTALFVMGEEAALEFWRSSGYDFDLVLVTRDGRVAVTSGIADAFTEAEDSGYVYETVS